jgi:hypothetical protein
MTTQTVTEDYLEGIREGRTLLRQWQLQGEPDIASMARVSLDTTTRLCREFDAQSPVGQMFRGERDFWRNQLKKL